MAQRRGPWSQQEDNYLMQLVTEQGPLNWVRIAQALSTRTPKQCRERFHQNLKPSLNHEPITAEEGAQIEQLVNDVGKRWAEIARRLNGRSDNAVKNWWNGSQNRRRRHDRRRANQSITTYDEHRITAYDEHRYIPTPFPRPALTVDARSTAMSLPRHALSSPISPTFYGRGPSYYQMESPLPSPCSTSSPGSDGLDGEASTISDITSSYTTSPQCLSRGTSPALHPLQLAPLRNLDSVSLPRSLPHLGTIIPSKELAPRLSSIGPQLLTAPSSPAASYTAKALPPASPSTADKDSRMDVSSLLG